MLWFIQWELVSSKPISNFSSLFMTQDISERHLLPNNKLVSFAKWWIMHLFWAFLRSFMKIRKRRAGTNVEPWGTQHNTFFVWEKKLFIDTYRFLLVRKEWNQLFPLFLIPKWFNFSIKIWWSTVSKAFCKSIKTLQTILISND